ncbi:dehydrogenase/reductase SDR family member on chromosome X isoform X2 [Phymastichus coffea]|nr:dehydrogenase/reductase SDR family member on chromosome X isoform X2 [Phymastichus coffea]XP_058808203.1 dehydrogenase/reductase SDR family member on chromosome X isoform X2 [Phymastichus coffea]XP_058808204.1 dehydrogenase/reductase SDR family member on chromosome X isoform X2 [Phymastichus coffea]
MGTMGAERCGWFQSRGDFRMPRSYSNAFAVRRSVPAMLLQIALGSTIIGIVGLTLVKSKAAKWAFNWFFMQIKYNAVALRGIADDYLQARNNKTDLPHMPNRVAIVTGGSRGIGLEIVKMLLKCDMHVIIACRRPEAGEKAIRAIRESGITTGAPEVMELDNASLESVKRFVNEFKNNYQQLDILVNNAGIMFTPYAETKEGFEEQYGVNYLSHFYLTILLTPLLRKAGTAEHCSRVVNVSSLAHLLGDIRFDDINHRDNFLTYEAYAQSKLAQVLSTKSLAKNFDKEHWPIRINAVHPGLVSTDLFDHSYLRYFKFIANVLFKTPAQGATSIVFAAVDPRMEQNSGQYTSNCREVAVNPLVNNEALQDRLFQFSLKQVGLHTIPT